MKKISINIVAALAILLTGCEKSTDYNATFYEPGASDARLKVIYASAYALNPLVQLSIDDVRVSGLITGRTPFPGGGYNTAGSSFPDYIVVAPGSRKFTVAIPKKNTNVDSVVLFTTQIMLEAGKNQTLNISDTLTKTKALLVTDFVEKPAPRTVKYRFVNLMPNVPLLDLYYGTTRVATGIAYNTPGVIFSMPVPAVNNLNWAIRETGTTATSTALAVYASASTVVTQRMFTAFAMGYKPSNLIATLRPYISFTINY